MVVLAVLGLFAVLQRPNRRALLILVALGLGSLTVQRNATYHSDVSIWRDTAMKRFQNGWARTSYRAALYQQKGLGNILAQSGDLHEAAEQYRTAIICDPGNASARPPPFAFALDSLPAHFETPVTFPRA